ncbi:MAG: hypothetical protein Ct9H300mP28_37040 [Pseudomonadota bacterium]|nr:MAG: hypothetical protein Ct9H300mP28_37040 [Pseudomonadota bacterium]
MSWPSNRFSIISTSFQHKKNLEIKFIFMVEHLLGNSLNSSLQAQRKITVLLAPRAIWPSCFGFTSGFQSPLGSKKTYCNVEDA